MDRKGLENKIVKYPLVSIVTVNYNKASVTCELIDSLKKITYPNIEVIVVDNASPDERPDMIKQKHPGIVFVQNPINYGFAAGNNFGIMCARGKYVLLLNNDTIVTTGFLEPLVDFFETHQNVGALSPKIRFYYEPDIIQYAGFNPINKHTLRNSAIGFKEKDNGQYQTSYETAFAHGAAMMVPMEVIKQVGMMSYIYFLYYEEADWCERIKRAGYSIWFIHNSLIYHKESVSTGKSSSLKTYYLTRNRIIYMRRNFFGKDFIIGFVYQLVVSIPKNSAKYLINIQLHDFIVYYKALFWNIRHAIDPEIHENPHL
jgi:GT2 family glycosyltransferase